MGIKRNHISKDQGHLPFRAKNAGMWVRAYPFERRVVLVLSVFVAVSAVVYIFFMMSSVMHVAAREEASLNASKLSAEVARLEAEYLTRTEAITESFARKQGFVALSERTFVEQARSVSFQPSR